MLQERTDHLQIYLMLRLGAVQIFRCPSSRVLHRDPHDSYVFMPLSRAAVYPASASAVPLAVSQDWKVFLGAGQANA